MMVHSFNPSTGCRDRWISEFEVHIDVHREFQNSQSHNETEKPYLKKGGEQLRKTPSIHL